MWEKLKKKIIDNILIEIKNNETWDNIDNLVIAPFTDKMKYDIKTKECEHISFNKNFNMYLNPKFLVRFNRIW